MPGLRHSGRSGRFPEEAGIKSHPQPGGFSLQSANQVLLVIGNVLLADPQSSRNVFIGDASNEQQFEALEPLEILP
jgi:hypothetical protein